jgi:hypothetical protein
MRAQNKNTHTFYGFTSEPFFYTGESQYAEVTQYRTWTLFCWNYLVGIWFCPIFVDLFDLGRKSYRTNSSKNLGFFVDMF